MAANDTSIKGFPTNPVEAAKTLRDDPLLTVGKTDLLDADIANITRGSGFGDLRSAISASYWGINHRGFGIPIQNNSEQEGLFFMTRPRLNLSYDNIKYIRKLTPLLTSDPLTKERAIRAYLDPDGSVKHYPATFVDHRNPFISLLTNNYVSISGWPDPSVDTYTSEAGLYKQQWSMIDGIPELNEVYDLSINFRNIPEDPITYLFHIWTLYAGYIHEGRITPRPDQILENEIDYMSRIYRVNLDPTREFVTGIANTGAGFPTTDVTGSKFNTSEMGVFSRAVDQVSCQYKALCVEYYDNISVKEFNDLGVLFNPDMADGKREKAYIALPSSLKPYFNHEGYFRINPYTSEFEIWVPKDKYDALLKSGILPKNIALKRK